MTEFGTPEQVYTAYLLGDETATEIVEEWAELGRAVRRTEHQFGSPGCTCVPFTRQTDPPRRCEPGDTVDMISGWERGSDCPHHAVPEVTGG